MNPIDGAYLITNLSQVVEVNWVLLKSYYRLPRPPLSPRHPPHPFLSLSLSCPASEEWGIAACGKLIPT